MTDQTKTRAELILSAQQWATAVCEWIEDSGSLDIDIHGRMGIGPDDLDVINRKMDGLKGALSALKEMEK